MQTLFDLWLLRLLGTKNYQYNEAGKQAYVDYLGGRCRRCGFEGTVSALEFHHLRNKKFNIFKTKYVLPMTDEIKTELAKCILLCMSCHRKEHSK